MASMFTKASRKRVYLKVGLMGPSGSGKTYSALVMARAIAGPDGQIAVIDTENGSASLYSHLTDFDVADIAPPFDPKKYIAAIHEAEAAGYSVVVIDSFTHAWKYLLDKKEKLDARGGRQNQYTNWGPVKAEADELKEAILQSKVHVIACMRAKTEYAQEGGKVQKVGMAAIQEPDVEYEFTTVFNIDMEHNAMPSKDRTDLFKGRIERISAKTGQALVDWLNSADSQETYTPPKATADVSQTPNGQTNGKKPLSPSAQFLKDIGMTAEGLTAYKKNAEALGMSSPELTEQAMGEGVDSLGGLTDYVDVQLWLKDEEVGDLKEAAEAKGHVFWRLVAQAISEGVEDVHGLAMFVTSYVASPEPVKVAS